MAWFKSDDGLHGHPKVRRARLAGMGLWVCAGTYSSAYKLDGFVPEHYVASWGADGRKAADALVKAGLWERSEHPGEGAGWQFHDWADYNPTAAEIEADREASRLRQRNSRAARREAATGKLRSIQGGSGS